MLTVNPSKSASLPGFTTLITSNGRWIKQRMLDPDLLLYKHADLTKLSTTASVPAVPVAGPSTLPPSDDTPPEEE
jgi:hypothetical protein